MLQYVAVCCGMLQYVAVCYSMFLVVSTVNQVEFLLQMIRYPRYLSYTTDANRCKHQHYAVARLFRQHYEVIDHSFCNRHAVMHT